MNNNDPKVELDIVGRVCFNNGSPYAAVNNCMQTGSLTTGGVNLNYGTGGNQWSSNTAGLMMECTVYTEMCVHDANTRVDFLCIMIEIKVGVKLKQKYQTPSQRHVIVGFYQVMH